MPSVDEVQKAINKLQSFGAEKLQNYFKSNAREAIGLYRHYKNGQLYELIGQAVHTEEKEPYAVYKALNDGNKLYVRPWAMFFEIITEEGKKVPRFKRML